MRSAIFWFSFLTGALALVLALDYFRPGNFFINPFESRSRERSIRERVRRADERSQNVKGVYMTSAVANDRGIPATRLRESIVELLETTELNGAVIDVKETDGGAIISENLRSFVASLREKGVWTIARIAVFKDSSQEKVNPEWYLKRSSPAGKSPAIWRDRRGGLWLDPSSPEVWRYQIDAAKAASAAGFDEVQFDYIRFPSDGDVENIAYPAYDKKVPKHEVLKNFFTRIHDELKQYRPDLILSADLFGYVALQTADLGIGQRLGDIGENFDYVSLMVYPSHYYDGFEVAADAKRNLAALFYPYQNADVSRVASSQPYDVVYRSLLIAQDALNVAAATPTPLKAGAKPGEIMASSPASPRRVRLRPWLQDFDLAVDTRRGIRYDAQKVRAQIDAAEAAGSSGWMLWSPDNVYTKEALKPEGR